jgi:glucosylceramidase
MRPGVCVVAAAALLAGCGRGAGMRVETWVTTADHAKTLSREPDLRMGRPARAPTAIIAVDERTTYQTMIGFGAAMTDASAYVIRRNMSVLQELFGRHPGLGLSFVRVPLGASDFSLHDYSYDDVAADTIDKIPVLRQALAINRDIFIMATPWSPPGWMKTSGSLIGGTLAPEHYGDFAEHMARAVETYDAAGVPIKAISVQNEPHFEPKDYPGMRLEATARARVIADYVGPRFKGLAEIWDWDHNWDFAESPLGVLADSGARRYVQGVAWHCYAGDVSAQSRVRDAYPDKDVYFTECSGGGWSKDYAANLRWFVGTLIIGTTRNWARAVAFWNLALDAHDGPHTGGCTDCRGVVTIDSTGAVTRNVEYVALAHASQFVLPGAVRIASTSGVDSLASVGFRNPDRSTALIVFNESHTTRAFAVQVAGREFRYRLSPASVATFKW